MMCEHVWLPAAQRLVCAYPTCYLPIQADNDVTMSWVSALLMGRTFRPSP